MRPEDQEAYKTIAVEHYNNDKNGPIDPVNIWVDKSSVEIVELGTEIEDGAWVSGALVWVPRELLDKYQAQQTQDPVDDYFECVTQCEVSDKHCVKECVSDLKDSSHLPS